MKNTEGGCQRYRRAWGPVYPQRRGNRRLRKRRVVVVVVLLLLAWKRRNS